MDGRVELRSESGRLVGVLVGGTALEIKRGCRLYTLDVGALRAECDVVIFERVLYPDGAATDETADNANSSLVE